MDTIQLVTKLGEGSFATVYKGKIRGSTTLQQPVAIKELKQRGLTFEQLISLSEVAALREAGRHPNLVTLLSVSLIPVPISHGGSRAFLVMDLCEHGSLLDAIERRSQGAAGGSFSEGEIRGAMRDLLLALAHLHGDNGTRSIPLAHRDVKPENILVGPSSSSGQLITNTKRELICKLCDFGQAATLMGRKKLTTYVGTRWYRAPELLSSDTLDLYTYTHSVDLWAAGCVMAELFLLRPLFPGSSDADQLFRISSVLGKGSDIRGSTGLSILFPKASPEAINVLKSLLHMDPRKRLSATEVLSLPFFRSSLEETVLRATGSGQSKSAAGDAMLRAAADEAQLSLDKDLEYVKRETTGEEINGKVDDDNDDDNNNNNESSSSSHLPPHDRVERREETMISTTTDIGALPLQLNKKEDGKEKEEDMSTKKVSASKEKMMISETKTNEEDNEDDLMLEKKITNTKNLTKRKAPMNPFD